MGCQAALTLIVDDSAGTINHAHTVAALALEGR